MTDEAKVSKDKREVSTIGFPYLDLDDAITVARAVLSRGGVAMDRDQVAAALNQAPTSGAFAMKLNTARSFGLIDNSQGRFQLTPLGFEILDAAREREAKIVAFLNVPLYRKAYDEFRGKQLPPRPAGLERAFEQFGVSSKQTDKARQAFDRSARSAGFFPTPAEDRLVQPVIGPIMAYDMPPNSTDVSAPVHIAPAPEVPRAVSAKDSFHPFIDGLLVTLPKPGEDWPTADRAKWLQTAANIFDLIYSGGQGSIAIKAE